MTTPQRSRTLVTARSEVAFRLGEVGLARWISCLCTVLILLGGAAGAAQAQGAATRIGALNKQALDAFDNLNFDQAKTLLEQAIVESEGAGLAKDPVAARSHLNLGMLLIAGFQQRDRAIDHFQMALKIQRDIAAPPGLFNPEVQAVFDEVKANFKPEVAPPPRPARPNTAPPVRARTPKASAAPTASQGRPTIRVTTNPMRARLRRTRNSYCRSASGRVSASPKATWTRTTGVCRTALGQEAWPPRAWATSCWASDISCRRA